MRSSLDKLIEMQIISMKQLREDFEPIRDALEKGQEFLLLYRSKPLAKLMPYTQDVPSFAQKPMVTQAQVVPQTRVEEPVVQPKMANPDSQAAVQVGTTTAQPAATSSQTLERLISLLDKKYPTPDPSKTNARVEVNPNQKTDSSYSSAGQPNELASGESIFINPNPPTAADPAANERPVLSRYGLSSVLDPRR